MMTIPTEPIGSIPRPLALIQAAAGCDGDDPVLDQLYDEPRDTIARFEAQLLDSGLIRTIFKVRELVLGGRSDPQLHPASLLAQMQSIGWVVLAQRDHHEVVLGAVTRPWEAAPVFRSIPASEFAGFSEPGYVKIVWTLRAEPLGDRDSVFHTETRVSTTDISARRRFALTGPSWLPESSSSGSRCSVH